MDEHFPVLERKSLRSETPAAQEMLMGDGCLGDLLWQPISRAGPVDSRKYPVRAIDNSGTGGVNLAFIQRGKRVLLALGPCGICQEFKTDVLEAILESGQPLLTHLAVDSWTVRRLFGVGRPEPGELRG
jgi:hypothetical protein